MRKLLLLGALLALGCKSEPTPQPPPKKLVDIPTTQDPTKQPESAPINNAPKPVVEGSWPDRPATVFAEFRVEGVLPTAQAILNQARKISPEIPPVEAMVGVGIGSLLGLTDMSVINVSLAAGGLLVDLPQEPAPLVYLGISNEEGFRKALPAAAITGDPKGNALVFAPPDSSKLGAKEIYVNFVGSYVVGSPSSEAFALVKPHLEAIVAKPLGSPAVWVAVEVSAPLKRFAKEIEAGISTVTATMPPTPGMDNAALFKGMLSMLEHTDEVELRHTPSAEAYHLSFYVKPLAGSSFEARLKKPVPTLIGLEKRIPMGWMSGSMFMDPETLKESMALFETMMPQMKSVNYFSQVALDSLTGESSLSTSMDGKLGVVLVYAAKDEKAFRDELRKTFAKEQKITMGTNEITYSAIQIDAETVGGVAVDIVETNNNAPTTPAIAAMGLSSQKIRYAYLPGLVVLNMGESTTALEAVLAGESGSFVSSPEVKVAFAELPAERLGAVFFSLPQTMKVLSSFMPVGFPTALPDIKSGAAFGWWVEGDKLRFETIVPISHITDMINFFTAVSKRPATPLP